MICLFLAIFLAFLAGSYVGNDTVGWEGEVVLAVFFMLICLGLGVVLIKFSARERVVTKVPAKVEYQITESVTNGVATRDTVYIYDFTKH